MTAVVETSWLPYGFTMNYRFTRPGTVTWAAGEPYAQFCLVRASAQEAVQPIIRPLDADPQLRADFVGWMAKRAELRERVAAGDPETMRAPWDKDYFLGLYPDGRPTASSHLQRLRLRSPIDERG